MTNHMNQARSVFTLLVLLLLFLVLLFLFPVSSYAQAPVLRNPAPYELGGQYPTDLEVVDINNDGLAHRV